MKYRMLLHCYWSIWNETGKFNVQLAWIISCIQQMLIFLALPILHSPHLRIITNLAKALSFSMSLLLFLSLLQLHTGHWLPWLSQMSLLMQQDEVFSLSKSMCPFVLDDGLVKSIVQSHSDGIECVPEPELCWLQEILTCEPQMTKLSKLCMNRYQICWQDSLLCSVCLYVEK